MRYYRPLASLLAFAICATAVHAQPQYRQPGFGYTFQPTGSQPIPKTRNVYSRPGDPSAVPPGFYQPHSADAQHASPHSVNANVGVPNSRYAIGQSRSQQAPPHPAVVRVIAAEKGATSLGSGTLIDANDNIGLVITNWHVVRDATAGIKVVFPDGFQSVGQVLRTDSEWDLAAVLINKPHAAPVKVAGDAPRIGEMLTIAGYGSGAYRSASGQCLQYLAPGTNHPFEIVELGAAARQGDSGGPIFNSRGELAGVLFGEGDGRTSGSYCGRVHRFLSAASADVAAVQRSVTQLQMAGARAGNSPTVHAIADSRSVDSSRNQTPHEPARQSRGWQPRAPNVAASPSVSANSILANNLPSNSMQNNSAPNSTSSPFSTNSSPVTGATQPQMPLVPVGENAARSNGIASDEVGRYWQPPLNSTSSPIVNQATPSPSTLTAQSSIAAQYGQGSISLTQSESRAPVEITSGSGSAYGTREAGIASSPASNPPLAAFTRPGESSAATAWQVQAASGLPSHPAAISGVDPTDFLTPELESVSDANDWTWQALAGDTLIAQVKTVLSAIGVLAILFHMFRAANKPAAKRSKKKPKGD